MELKYVGYGVSNVYSRNVQQGACTSEQLRRLVLQLPFKLLHAGPAADRLNIEQSNLYSPANELLPVV